MPSKNNITQVEILTEKIGKAKAIYFTDFLGLDVSSITELILTFPLTLMLRWDIIG